MKRYSIIGALLIFVIVLLIAGSFKGVREGFSVSFMNPQPRAPEPTPAAAAQPKAPIPVATVQPKAPASAPAPAPAIRAGGAAALNKWLNPTLSADVGLAKPGKIRCFYEDKKGEPIATWNISTTS